MFLNTANVTIAYFFTYLNLTIILTIFYISAKNRRDIGRRGFERPPRLGVESR